MNRRSTLERLSGGFLTFDDEPAGSQEISPYANKVLPDLQRTTAGLEPYTGTWGIEQILHLLRRTTFGPARAHVSTLKGQSMNNAVDSLLSVSPEESSKPLNTDTRDLVPVGDTWVYSLYQDPNSTFNPSGIRATSLKAWWTGLLLNQELSIREKMVLFWHNHFVTERDAVGDPRYTYRYAALLRTYALGNWKNLTREMSYDGAMLRYLNGNTNTRTSPNENYGRELLELFTIGKGPEVAVGDYTNYTEVDVKAAARVLTGWQEDSTQLTNPTGKPWKFTSSRHDTTNKQFSSRFGNRVITGGTDGLRELNDLLDMIFAQEETAKFLCRKLYRWFVYYVIDGWTENNIIAPLATVLRSNNYEISPVLSTLFKSAHFYDPLNMGCIIKSPLDHMVGVSRIISMAFPSSADVTNQYRMWTYLTGKAAAAQQDIGDPPNVAGWQAYYQSPQFYELWINSDTLPKRTASTDTLVRTGYTASGFKLFIDTVTFATGLTNPSDPNDLVEESAQLIFAIPITASQKTFLKQILIPGLPDYEWTDEWTKYVADPTNAAKLAAVRSKLQALYAFMLSMPEFQLL